jgi:hypothetical protein
LKGLENSNWKIYIASNNQRQEHVVVKIYEIKVFLNMKTEIWVITKLPNSEQSYKGKVKTHNYINRQNQSTTGKL